MSPRASKSADDAADYSANAMEITQCVVQIDRDSTVSIPVTCFEYEVEVLKEIHGELNVREVSSKTVTVPAFTAAEAHARLLGKFRQHIKAVREVYRTPKVLARQSGLRYQEGDDKAAQFQAAEIVDNSGAADSADA